MDDEWRVALTTTVAPTNLLVVETLGTWREAKRCYVSKPEDFFLTSLCFILFYFFFLLLFF